MAHDERTCGFNCRDLLPCDQCDGYIGGKHGETCPRGLAERMSVAFDGGDRSGEATDRCERTSLAGRRCVLRTGHREFGQLDCDFFGEDRPSDAKVADPDEGCDCDAFEGGEHTRLCASVKATEKRRATNRASAEATPCSRCNGTGKDPENGC